MAAISALRFSGYLADFADDALVFWHMGGLTKWTLLLSLTAAWGGRVQLTIEQTVVSSPK